MKTCHVCGCQVDDKELICPDCGATVVMATSGLSLKNEAPTKKKAASSGPSISTGSGLTDILRADDDDVAEEDPLHGGSVPYSLTQNVIEEEERRKKKNISKVFGTIFKIVLLAAAAYGIYYLVVNVFMKKEGASSYEAALDMYVEAVNDDDAAKMKQIVPTYMSYPQDTAQDWIDSMTNVEITSYDIINTVEMDDAAMLIMQDDIKLEKNKSADIREGVTVTVEIRANVVNASGATVSRGGEIEMDFIRLSDKWYFYSDSFDTSMFK